jgi:succinate-semialdehyde dehydrogenase/glutarate-semialdehyde dehydrogenase
LFIAGVLVIEVDMRLKNPELLQQCSFINNNWVKAANQKTFDVTNPATGEVITGVADCLTIETEQSVEAAAKAFPSWSQKTALERGAILQKWYSLIIDNIHDLALIMTTEQGKPLQEAKGEVTYGASFIQWFAEEARRIYGDIIPTPAPGKRLFAIKQPVGVVAAITPWNFPVSMITRKISPALAAGCTVVVKPPSETPLSALAMAYLAKEAGFPPGVINMVTTTDSKTVGKILSEHPKVQKLSFTGSTEVGKLLMAQCASTIKKVSLELGGNAPSIVFDDADIEQAVRGTLVSKYRNAGQTCVCTNRIFVQENIYDGFMQAYRAAVANLKVGPGTEEGIQIGPLITEKSVRKVERLLADAVSKGGRVTVGGNRDDHGTLFFQPTIVEDCNGLMAISEEEIFGPVSGIFKFRTEEEVIEMANNTTYGLAAYFFSQNINRVWRVAEALQYGMIGINEGIISHAEAPFGGVKESGIGREGSKYGIEDYIEIKYLCLGGM